MASWQILLLAVYGVIVLITFLRHLMLGRSLQGTPEVSTRPREDDEFLSHLHQWAGKVSILVPAKDEEAGIDECIACLLQQDFPSFELLIIDDRSEDHTAQIVKTWEEKDCRVRLVSIENLPPGWTGKTHALHVGQQHATGDWLVFVDADTFLHPQCISQILDEARTRQVQMVSLMPALHSGSFWERVVQPFAGMCLMVFFPLAKVNDPKRKDLGFANGQFILLSRSAYDQMGGHESVKDKFVEDVHIGRKLRQLEIPSWVVMAPSLARVRMYASLPAIVRGWSRILYSSFDAKLSKAFSLLWLIMIFSVLGYVTFLGGGLAWLLGYNTPFIKWIFFLGLAHQFFQATLMARLYKLSHSRVDHLPFRILAVAVMVVVCLNVMRLSLTGQVTWRGTRYGKELNQSSPEPTSASSNS